MRRHVHAAAIAATLIGSAYGQECHSINSDADRLLCYDAKFPRATRPPEVVATPATPPSAAAVEPPPVETAITLPRFMKNFRLANETTPSGALRSDPATFSYANLNGEEYSTVQAALIWEPGESWFPDGSYLAQYGWGPFASYSVNRNSLSTKRADVRQGAIGLYGTVFRISAQKEPGALIAPIALGMVTKLEAAHRRNRVDDTESAIYTVDNWVVSRWLFDGIPYTDKFAWFVTPRAGLQFDDRRQVKMGGVRGEIRSAFGQLKADLFPGIISNRMKVTLLTQRYVDLSASTGIAERAETFSKVGVELLLYPPRLVNAAVQPSIALERSYGADLLNGLPKQGLTQLVFKLKLN